MEYCKNKFEGKKLLILGTNSSSCEMVKYARSQGAYVIVTDNLPAAKSAAKQIADESWMVSTADVDTIEKLARQNKVDGVFAGASEFNLEAAMTVCERMGLPFFCNRTQWEICSDKLRFKQLCRDNGVPVIKEYRIDGNYRFEDLNKIKYPVVVKPVDLSAGKGLRLCQNQDQLRQSYEQALSLSKTKKAIVEEFVEGDEFTAAYTIKNGEFRLTFMMDRYVDLEPSEMRTMGLPQAFILPSKYIDKYIAELNTNVIKMFKSIGLMNGFIFVQGRLNDEGFHLFESNYRLGGSSFHRFNIKLNGVNCMEMLVNYALTGEMDGYDLRLINPKFNRYCCCLPLLSKGGIVGKISGLEEIRNKHSLIDMDNVYEVGDCIEKSGTLKQIILRFFLVEDTPQEINNSIRQIQDTVKVLDDQGNDMLLPPFNINRIQVPLFPN
jgi:biotin carboxylase